MKQKHLFLFIAALCAVLFVSCKRDAYKNAIPANAFVVAEVDIADLALKSDAVANKDRIMNIVRAVTDDRQMQDEIRGMFDNPLSLGINFLKPACLFAFGENSDDLNGGLLFAVSSMSKLKSALNDEDLTAEETDGILYLYDKESLIGGANKHSLLLGISSKTLLLDLLRQNEENSFYGTAASGILKDNSGDIAVMMNTKTLPYDIKREVKDEILSTLKAFDDKEKYADIVDDLQVVANLQFHKGEILLNVLAHSDNELLLKAQENTAKIDKAALAYLPTDDLFAMMACGIDMTSSREEIDRTIAEYTDEIEDGQVRRLISSLVSAVCKLNGTMAVSVKSENIENDPKVVALLPIDKAEVNQLMDDFEEIAEEDLRQMVNLKGNQSITAISTIDDYEFEKASQPFKYAGNAADKYLYAYVGGKKLVDMIYDNYTSSYSYRRYASKEERKSTQMIFDLCYKADYAELYSDSNNRLTLRLALTEDSKNALAVLLNGILDIAEAN